MPQPRSVQRVRIHPLGDTALLAELGSRLDTAVNTRAIGLAAALRKRRDVRQAVAGYASVTVHFDPDQTTLESLGAAIKRLALPRPKEPLPRRPHPVPLVYDGVDMPEGSGPPHPSPPPDLALHTPPHSSPLLL